METHQWEPKSGTSFLVHLCHLVLVPLTVPTLLPFVFSRCEATAANARWWRSGFITLGLGVSGILHSLLDLRLRGCKSLFDKAPSATAAIPRCLSHVALFGMVGHPFMWMAFIAHHLIDILSLNRQENRLNAGRLKGPRVLVVGNGPSALEGEQFGDEIDKFDEVIRFNNFQTKGANMQPWVGTKTTVHFSDGVLYPTYKEYHVPGATIVLSLLADRFIVAGTYLGQRGAFDLQVDLTLKFLKDPTTTWIEKERIEHLKKEVGLTGVKHPTSGLLAIDYFVNKEGVELPVYIHGFDFFQGKKMHYFDETEPLWERINDRIGVNQHSPLKEKVYVDKLIKEGKVKLLKHRRAT